MRSAGGSGGREAECENRGGCHGDETTARTALKSGPTNGSDSMNEREREERRLQMESLLAPNKESWLWKIA